MAEETKKFRSFDDFTNLYELSKTLRFELKPIGKTEKFLKKNKIFEKDKFIDDNYHKIKYYFDYLHSEFINFALQKIYFSNKDYENFETSFRAMRLLKDKNQTDKFKKIKEDLRKEIVNKFNDIANEWKESFERQGIVLKHNGVRIFFEKDSLEVLKNFLKNKPINDPKAPDIKIIDQHTGEKKNLFDIFKGFYTYFINFNESRKNFYSAEAKDTAIANRVIDENLVRFCENKLQFNSDSRYQELSFTIKEKEIFNLVFYNKCFSQDGIDAYNQIIGGIINEKTGEKIKGLNEKINLYNQKNKGKKLQQFQPLYKQILSKKNEQFFDKIEINNDQDVFYVLGDLIKLNDKKITLAEKLITDFLKFQENKYDLERVYLKGTALNTISNKWFLSWNIVGSLLSEKSHKKFQTEEYAKIPDFISFAKLSEVLHRKSIPNTEEFIPTNELFRQDYGKLQGKNHYETFLNILSGEFGKCLANYRIVKKLLEDVVKKEKIYKKDERQIQKIKNYCDSSLAIFQMMKYFALEKGKKLAEELERDNTFYNDFEIYYKDYNFISYYNEFRNYLTKKSYLGRLLFPSFKGDREQRHELSRRRTDGAEKIKLNFENSMLLGGWDRTKEPDCFGLLFKKQGKFYLGILRPDQKNVFTKSDIFLDKSKAGDFFKMDYKQLNNVYRQLPRIAFAGRNKKKYGITKEIEKIRNEFTEFQKNKSIGDVFEPAKLQKLINLYKRVLKDSYTKEFDLSVVLKTKYASLNEFYGAVEKCMYAIRFTPIQEEYVFKLVDGGKLFLFQIYNKDFSEKSHGKENLHTLYFKALFEDNNLKKPVLKLSGGAEIFFRPKNKDLNKKEDSRGKKIIEHKRYGVDKIFFHVPIVLNIGAKEGGQKGRSVNSRVNSFIAANKNVNIIGIDRGEKNLAYYSVIDKKARILEIGSLNNPLRNKDYSKLLEEKAGKRDEARKSWQTIENIKELKSGYISQVIRKICDLVIKYNAIVVFEDLNIGFKRGRQKIEKQIYQKLELALAQKLNYLVNKATSPNLAGHYLNAYQFTPQTTTFQDIGKQCGILFYTTAGYTSLTCPNCGYRKNFTLIFENIIQARKEIEELKLEILYNKNNDIFSVDYMPFGESKRFRVYSNVERIRWHKRGTDYAKNDRRGEQKIKESGSESGINKKYLITECIKGLFDEYKINFSQSLSLIAENFNKIESANFYRQLFRYLNLMLSARNSISGTDIDYIQCCRCGFDSRKSFQGKEYNGDANGAYNIARKGLIILNKIRNIKEPEKIQWKDLKVTLEDWDKFTQIIAANKN